MPIGVSNPTANTVTLNAGTFSITFKYAQANAGQYSKLEWLGSDAIPAADLLAALGTSERFIVFTPIGSNSYLAQANTSPNSDPFAYTDNGNGTALLSWFTATQGESQFVATPREGWIEFQLSDVDAIPSGYVLGVALRTAAYSVMTPQGLTQAYHSLVMTDDDTGLCFGIVANKPNWRPAQNGHKRLDLLPGSLFSGEDINDGGWKFAIYVCERGKVKDILGQIAASIGINTTSRMVAEGSQISYLMITDAYDSGNLTNANADALADMAVRMGPRVGIKLFDGSWRTANTKLIPHANAIAFISRLVGHGLRVVMHLKSGFPTSDSGVGSFRGAEYSGQYVDTGVDSTSRWKTSADGLTDAAQLESDYIDALLAAYETGGFNGGVYWDNREAMYGGISNYAAFVCQRWSAMVDAALPDPWICGASGVFQNEFLQQCFRQARDLIVYSDHTAQVKAISADFDAGDGLFQIRPNYTWLQSHYLGTLRPWDQWQAVIEECRKYDGVFGIQGSIANLKEFAAAYDLAAFAGPRSRPQSRPVPRRGRGRRR